MPRLICMLSIQEPGGDDRVRRPKVIVFNFPHEYAIANQPIDLQWLSDQEKKFSLCGATDRRLFLINWLIKRGLELKFILADEFLASKEWGEGVETIYRREIYLAMPENFDPGMIKEIF